MKKIMFFAVIIGMLVFGANAFALNYTALDGSDVFGLPGTALTKGGSTSFAFNGVPDSFKSATFTLAFIKASHSFSDTLYLGQTFIYKFAEEGSKAGSLTYDFTKGNNGTLALLNSAISKNHSLTFTLMDNSGHSTITSAGLNGKYTMAPEPISMALVGAGIVALPFARRLKRSLRKEA